MATVGDLDLTEKSEVNPTPPPAVRDNPVLRTKVWNRMNIHNDNWMAAVVGETGSGKSYGALRIAEAVDPDFSVDQVAFGIVEFMKLVTDDSLGRGSIIVFEEASVEANAQEWFTKGNKVLRQVLDTWRHQNRGAIFTLPAFGQLSKQARGRMSALIQMQGINHEENYSVAKYKWCDQDSDTGKIYKKYPVLGGKKYKRIKIQRPSDSLVEAYEERKQSYTTDLNEGLLEELLEEQAEKEAEEKGLDDPLAIADDIISEELVDEYIQDNHGQKYLDRDLIELDYGIGESKSKKVKKQLQREGVADV